MIVLTALAALSLLGSTAPPTEPTTTVAPTTTGVPATIPEDFVLLVDSTQAIVVAAPTEWTETNIGPVTLEDGSEVPYIVASTAIETFQTSFDAPGVQYIALPRTTDLLSLVNAFGPREGCATLEVKEYSDPVFEGVIQIGTECGPDLLTWNMVVANPIDGRPFTALLQIQAADAARIQSVLLTFNIGPNADAVFVTTTAPSTTTPPVTT